MKVKFCYCPQCQELRPKNWHSGSICYRCQDECILISVPRTALGYLMYLADIISGGMLVLYILHHNANMQFAGFINAIPETIYIVIMFSFIILAFVFGFVDLKWTTEKAWQKVSKKEM